MENRYMQNCWVIATESAFLRDELTRSTLSFLSKQWEIGGKRLTNGGGTTLLGEGRHIRKVVTNEKAGKGKG